MELCPNCGQGKLRAKQVIQPMIVDGQRQRASVRVWSCSKCHEQVLHYEDWKQTADAVRSQYSGQFRLRLDRQLHARLAQAAREDQRSLNQEVVYLLQEGLRAAGKT